MGQVFRITHEQKDYTVKLLNTRPISSETESIDLLLENIPYKLIKSNGNWAFENVEDNYLLKLSFAIGKSITLRYRI